MLQKSVFVVLSLVVLTFGCATNKAAQYDTQQATSVDLTKANYNVIKSNAVGNDRGLNFLGIPLITPSVVDAMGELREQAPMEGKATAVTNVIQEDSKTWLLLFSIPKVTVSADIVEFEKTRNSE